MRLRRQAHRLLRGFGHRAAGGGGFSTQIEWESGSGAASIARPDASYVESHAYTTGSAYTARLLFAFPFGCAPIDIPVPLLEECPAVCPTIGRLSAVAEGCNVLRQRRVRVTASLGGFGEVTYRWVWGDGTPDASGSLPVPSTISDTHDYAPPGPYTARLEILDPPDCPAAEITVGPLAECPPGPVVFPPRPPGSGTDTDEDEDDESSLCLGLRLVILVGLVVAEMLAFLAACVPDTSPVFTTLALIAAAIDAVLILVWLFTCWNPCDGLLLLWQMLVVSGALMMWAAGCCEHLFYWGVAQWMAGMAAYGFWVDACNPGACRQLEELFVAYFFASTTFFGTISPYFPCANHFIEIVMVGLATATLFFSRIVCDREGRRMRGRIGPRHRRRRRGGCGCRD